MAKTVILLACLAFAFCACTPAAEETPAEPTKASAPEPSLDK